MYRTVCIYRKKAIGPIVQLNVCISASACVQMYSSSRFYFRRIPVACTRISIVLIKEPQYSVAGVRVTAVPTTHGGLFTPVRLIVHANAPSENENLLSLSVEFQ